MRKAIVALKKPSVVLLIASIILFSPLMAMGNSLVSTVQSDNVLPVITIESPTNASIINSNFGDYPAFTFPLIYETNTALSWVGYSINGGSNITIMGNSVIVNESINDHGYNALTLYANNTMGNWATPQTVTYLVVFHGDETSAPNNPSSTSILTMIIVVLLIVVIISTVILLALRKRKS